MKFFRIEFGDHAEPFSTAESFSSDRDDVEQIRSWWVDSTAPGRDPRTRWARISEVRE